MSTEARYDIVAIGNAIVDVISQASDEFLEEEQLVKGSMALIDADRAQELYRDMGPAREISGGSGANTLAGASTLGCQCALIAQVADDQLGEVFAHDIRATGIDFDVPPLGKQPPTARCLIFVTQDAQRTMNTFLGASQFLPPAAVDADLIASGAILYLEGYLWDADEPKAAMALGIDIARKHERKVAFTLSDTFCVDRHRAEFRGLIDGGKIDILFANEAEIMMLSETEDFDAAVAETAAKVETLVVTRSEKGAIAVRDGKTTAVAAEPVDHIVDTTGAGDLFAAGFLSGYVEKRSMEDCLTMGAVAAAEVISHFGARPEADLRELVNVRLG
ncbi:MAG: sugar/nucleoside kinase (ribokinase family) [Parasphingorhabdus sp.]|jgi:sugar/nucleoside kinase (ribokinase family)|uniref:adenosine kinase n=1 Tax=Parasphingorhabdus sp. TaxID=2709688 RepID=UPI001B5FB010|nr:adenosine kinase [Parasphingorhabdus sp.]MBQ0772590.1 adenosine kinase [Sphingomonadales bacterium]|tara:strand:- start:355 stop:1353 length:999 start_codon:yes stop_codon:yes gene_type:complete